MRVTQGILFQQALDGVRRHTEALALQQAQISSGRRFERISEDPYAGSQAERLRARDGALERFLGSLDQARGRLDASAAALQDVSGILAEVKEVATQAGNPALTETDRDALAAKLDALLGQAVDAANRSDAFGHLFSGTSLAPPYQLSAKGAVYSGDGGVQKLQIGESFELAQNVPGSAVFSKLGRLSTLFFGGATGAKAGTGTDSGLDRGALLVTHGATTLGDGALAGGDSVSGLRLGTGTAQDTVLGPAGAHSIEVDAVAKTLRLDGGPTVSFVGNETSLALADGAGGLVHVDVSSLAAGFVGQVSLAATGFLSTDGGATQTAIAFSPNQTITSSLDGSTTNVDTQGVLRAGTEVIDYAGTSDLFQAIAGLRDDLRGDSGLPAGATGASLLARAREVDRNLENVLGGLAELGSRSKAAADASGRYQGMRDDLASVLSNLVDTDLAEAVVAYNKSQIALQVAQEAGSRLLQLDFTAFLR